MVVEVPTRRVAVLLTCHERVERTLGCLATLFAQDLDPATAVEVTLVDAASTDGTADAVEAHHPRVEVLRRGAELFWNGGMRVAWAHAWTTDPDHYLWLNDDVELDADALRRLLTTHDRLDGTHGRPSIVVGSTRDPGSGETTYGGVVRPSRWRPLHHELVEPGPRPREVETMNGNVVLVPRAVARRVGVLAAAYAHGMGDYDYGHRAGRAGCAVWVAPGTVGTCARNPAPTRVPTFAQHRRRLVGPTTGLPVREWVTFARRWAGPAWPLYALSPYVRRSLRWMGPRRDGRTPA